MVYCNVNSKIIVQNIKTARQKIGSAKFCAVVKANAYGMGDVRVANEIQKHVDMFAVARMHEAIRLRMNGISKPILLFGVCEDFKSAMSHDITVTIGSTHEMQLACRASIDGKLDAHIKVNTGMNRFGMCMPWHLRNALHLAAKYRNLNICGLYTHFSHENTSPQGRAEIDKQLARFAPYRAMMRRAIPRAIIHAACSGSIDYPPAQFDMVRVGKIMYGGYEGYRTAVTISAKIIAVQQLLKGQAVGYGGRFRAPHNMTVGIVSCGYAIAGFLMFGHTSHVCVDKKMCKILGSVCMDTVAIDVSDVCSPIGKTVTITGDMPGARIVDFINQSGLSGATYLCSLKFPILN